jgi:hypothetical protein
MALEKIDNEKNKKGGPAGKKQKLDEINMLQSNFKGRGYGRPEKNGRACI